MNQPTVRRGIQAVRLIAGLLVLMGGIPRCAADVIVMRLAPLEVSSAPLEVAAAIPPLLGAALESEKGYQLSAAPDAAWELRVDLSGKGPWKVAARAIPAATTRGASRVATGKVPLSGLEDLPRALDALVAQLHARLSSSGVPGAAAPAPPAPLSRALTPSAPAMSAWLDAAARLRDGQVAAARAALERGLAADPGFALARMELFYLAATLDESDATVGLAPPRPATADAPRSALAQDLSRGVDMMIRGEPARAFQVGELLTRDYPSLRWGRILRGLSLAAQGRRHDAVADWSAASKAEPDDPRVWKWTGLAQMAAGDMPAAAEALRRHRESWPAQLDAWALEAEARARARDLSGVRETLEAMRLSMHKEGIQPSSDATNPIFMLGSLELLEGRFGESLKRYEEALEAARASSGATPAGGIYEAIIELQREEISARDPLARDREIAAVESTLADYEAYLGPEGREKRPWLIPWLRGLVKVRAGDTVSGWRVVDQIKELADRPGYSEYWEAYLSAATLLKEGDMRGAIAQFERGARASDGLYDWIMAGQMRSKEKEYDEARRVFLDVEERLSHYEPGAKRSELVLTTPRLAASLPIFQYRWALIGYFTGNTEESRKHYNQMLKFYTRPDEELMPFVREALGRGAHPE